MNRSEYVANMELNEAAKQNKRIQHAHHSAVIIPPKHRFRGTWRHLVLLAFGFAVLAAYWYGGYAK